jgi:Protein of unknown function (DUF3179)
MLNTFSKNMFPLRNLLAVLLLLVGCSLAVCQVTRDSAGGPQESKILARPDLFQPLTEPPCSYCVNQNLKGLVKPEDPVIAWIRGAHNGGAIPLRHFLAAPRVINDTYGIFFYDPDGGYVAAYKKDYGYKFHGWRGGVMVVEGPDGTLWSALTGIAFSGPQKGKKLERVPNLMTTWANWLMLHPESTAYDMYDGKKYPLAELPKEIAADAKENMGRVDERLEAMTPVIGIESAQEPLAISLAGLEDRACFRDKVDDRSIAVFWYGPTQSSVAFESSVDGKQLTFYADKISPETAPFKDKETGTRWTLAGRAVDGPLKGKELSWVPSIQCRWYAWSHELPGTRMRKAENPRGDLAK